MIGVLAISMALSPISTAYSATGEEMAAQTRAASVAQLAPDATLDTIDGKRIELSEFYGRKPVYLKFWATWCVPCRQQMPHFENAWQRYGKSVAVVAVNLGLNDEVADVRRFLDETKLSMPVAIDSSGELAATFGVVVTPMHVLIDADGRIVYVGHEASEDLDGALEKLSHSTPQSKLTSAKRSRSVEHQRATVGNKAPEFSVDGATGKWTFTPGQVGKPTVIAFITPWCESYLKKSRPAVSDSCRKTRETLTRAYEGAPAGASWIAISSRVWSTQEDLSDYQAQLHVKHPVVLDATGEIFKLFGIREVPTVVIVGTDGIIRQRFDGFSPQLAAALASVSQASTH
jgi:peroxiredoxin